MFNIITLPWHLKERKRERDTHTYTDDNDEKRKLQQKKLSIYII